MTPPKADFSGPPVTPEQIVVLANDVEEAIRKAQSMAGAQRDRRRIEAILAGTDDDLDDTDRVRMDEVVEGLYEAIQDLEDML